MTVLAPSRSALIPLLVAVVGIASFTLMDAVMKGLSLVLGAYCAMVWRVTIALGTTALPMLRQGFRWPARDLALIHLKRGLVNAISAIGYFFGLTRLPMAEGIALSFIAPLVALYLSAAVLKEKVGLRAIVASALGLSGVVLLVASRLSGGLDSRALIGAVAILGAASVYGYGLILLRQQAQQSTPSELAFFQNGATMLWLLPGAPFFVTLPAVGLWPALIAGALLAQISTMLLAWAYARAGAAYLSTTEYSSFLWAMLLGWLAFGEHVSPFTLGGAALIVAGCIVAARAHPAEHVALEAEA